MTEHESKNGNDTDSAKQSDRIENTKPWRAKKELITTGYYAGQPFSKEELRELLQELLGLLLEQDTPKKLFRRKNDLGRINTRLQEFIVIQQQKYIDSVQWQMKKRAVKRLIELNLEIAQLLQRMNSVETFNKEKLNISNVIEMVSRSSKDAVRNWYPNKLYKHGKLNLNQS